MHPSPTLSNRTGRLMAAMAAAVLAVAAFAPGVVSANSGPFLNMLPAQTQIASTVPGNGDINPYGMAIVPRSTGALVKGDVLISNFNAASNFQGTGTTIDQIAPNGAFHLFATVMPSDVMGRCPGGVGLTTALSVLKSGWVIVGSLPTSDGTSATAKAGCLIVLDRWGHVAETIMGSPINGPWDMTAADNGDSAMLFVSNVLNDTVSGGGKVVHDGTVVRVDLSIPDGHMPMVTSEKVIGWGFPEKTDPAALVIGPTGLALSGRTLYVADTLDNRLAAIADAPDRMSASHKGKTITQNDSLNQPLGLAIAPNGDILSVNAGDGNAVETTPSGHQVVTRTIDAAGGGSLFGLVVAPNGHGLYFVADDSNTLQFLHYPRRQETGIGDRRSPFRLSGRTGQAAPSGLEHGAKRRSFGSGAAEVKLGQPRRPAPVRRRRRASPGSSPGSRGRAR
jgi:hypothetical protein